MRIRIEEDRCCGFASCTTVADTVFEVGADNVAQVVDPQPGEHLWPSVQEAAASCPTGAILIET